MEDTNPKTKFGLKKAQLIGFDFRRFALNYCLS